MPIMFIIYFLTSNFNMLAGKVVLIIGSIVFYAYQDISTFTILGISLIVNFLFTEFVAINKKRKMYLAIPIVINTGLLLYFKYTDFIITNVNIYFAKDYALKELVLPLGISFFTFQQIAYIVAVQQEEITFISVFDYLAYILYFPKLLMGPLMDPIDFISQFLRPRAVWVLMWIQLNIYLHLLKQIVI